MIAAIGLALLIAIAPWGPTQVVAGPSTCTVTKSGGSTSLQCLPGQTTPAGAPSEEEITLKNQMRRDSGLVGGIL